MRAHWQTALCRTYLTTGRCRYGSRCSFLHDWRIVHIQQPCDGASLGVPVQETPWVSKSSTHVGSPEWSLLCDMTLGNMGGASRASISFGSANHCSRRKQGVSLGAVATFKWDAREYVPAPHETAVWNALLSSMATFALRAIHLNDNPPGIPLDSDAPVLWRGSPSEGRYSVSIPAPLVRAMVILSAQQRDEQ